MDELIDIINPQDQVISQALKSQAHAEGLLHRTVISELIDEDGNWIMVKQAQDRQDPGQFVSPIGGHVQAGETEDEALAREAKEEVGLQKLKSHQFQLIGKAIFNRQVCGRQENHLFVVYTINVANDWQPILNQESTSWEKFTPSKLRQLVVAKSPIFGEAFWFVWNTFFPNHHHNHLTLKP